MAVEARGARGVIFFTDGRIESHVPKSAQATLVFAFGLHGPHMTPTHGFRGDIYATAAFEISRPRYNLTRK